MGNIIRIKEGGLPKAFGAAKLRTNLQGGGNCLWIPKESVPVSSKFITENGTYLAAADGLHGFSSLNVSSQPDYVVGKKGGKTYHVHKGGPTGNELIYDELPTEIRVTTPPTKNSYNNGQTINYNGIVVTAYKSDGSVWENENYPGGAIPTNELIFMTKKADRMASGSLICMADYEYYFLDWIERQYAGRPEYKKEEYKKEVLPLILPLKFQLQNGIVVENSGIKIKRQDYHIYPYANAKCRKERQKVTLYAENPMIAFLCRPSRAGGQNAYPIIVTPSDNIQAIYETKHEYYDKYDDIENVLPDDATLIGTEEEEETITYNIDDYDGEYKKQLTYLDKTVSFQRNKTDYEKTNRYDELPYKCAMHFALNTIRNKTMEYSDVLYRAKSYYYNSDYLDGWGNIYYKSENYPPLNYIMAWAIKYGGRNIVIGWKRPQDGVLLETSFGISIT